MKLFPKILVALPLTAGLAYAEPYMHVKLSYGKDCPSGVGKCVDEANDKLRGDISYAQFDAAQIYVDKCVGALNLNTDEAAKCQIGSRGKIYLEANNGCVATPGLGISFAAPPGLERFAILSSIEFDRAPRFCVPEKEPIAAKTGVDCNSLTTDINLTNGGSSFSFPRPETIDYSLSVEYGLPNLVIPSCEIEQVEGLTVHFESKLQDSVNPMIRGTAALLVAATLALLTNY